jgi:hypothetical protein
VFVAKYDTNGNQIWVHELGSTQTDTGEAVAVDNNGHVDVAGGTYGTLPGSPETHAVFCDVFVAQYLATG